MNNIRIQLVFLFVLLVLLQVAVLNQIHLFGVATPLLYVYFLLKLPVEMNRNLVLICSFLIGFLIDAFTFTWGINMLAMTVCGFLRFYFIRIFSPRDIFENFIPSFSKFGKFQFMGFASVIVIIHHIFVYVGDFFSFLTPLFLTLKIVSSILFTLLLIFAFESVKFNFAKR